MKKKPKKKKKIVLQVQNGTIGVKDVFKKGDN